MMAASHFGPRPADADFLRDVAASRSAVDVELNGDRLRALAALLDELRDGFDELTESGDSRRMIEVLVALFDGE
jgi:hypothetical protein